MRSQRFLLTLVLLSLTSTLFAQSKPEAPAAMDHAQGSTTNAPPSEAQVAFKSIKSLAGVWEGRVSLTPAMNGTESANMRVTMRVTSRGNALVHEMKGASDPDDASKYDHPVTLLYLNEGKLTLTHYCDAGNRPTMTALPSEDGKSVEFALESLSGGDKRGHMDHALFTIIDANHHIEEWTYMMPGNKPMRARVELHRVDEATNTTSGK